jgi:hypothetical protein
VVSTPITIAAVVTQPAGRGMLAPVAAETGVGQREAGNTAGEEARAALAVADVPGGALAGVAARL